MALLNLKYSRNSWDGLFHVYNKDKSVDFTIGNGKVQTGKWPTNIELMFQFTGTAPDDNQYSSYRFMFSLVYNGSSGLVIKWADGKKDTIGVSRTSAVLLDISAKAKGLLGVILDDDDIGNDNMVWEEYDNVAGRVPAK